MNVGTTFTAGAMQRLDAVRCGPRFDQGLLLLGREHICKLLNVRGAFAVNEIDLSCVRGTNPF